MSHGSQESRRSIFWYPHCQRKGWLTEARELYPYGMKLNSIDGMRVSGKFVTEDGAIPEGQGTVHTLLAECYELLHELRSEIDEEDD